MPEYIKGSWLLTDGDELIIDACDGKVDSGGRGFTVRANEDAIVRFWDPEIEESFDTTYLGKQWGKHERRLAIEYPEDYTHSLERFELCGGQLNAQRDGWTPPGK